MKNYLKEDYSVYFISIFYFCLFVPLDNFAGERLQI